MTEEFKANPELVNKQLAVDSHKGTSFDPEKRAISEIEGFGQYVNEVYENLKKYAKTEAQKDFLNAEMQRFQTGFADKYNARLSAKGRTISSFITGGSNFPVRRAEKANSAEDKRYQEMVEYRDRAQAAILRELKRMSIEEQGGELEVLKKKVTDAKRNHEFMVKTNAIIRKKITDEQKIKEMQTIQPISDKTARELLQPDFMKRIGFPAYALSNDTANIHRMEMRVLELEKKEVTDLPDIEFPGGIIQDAKNYDRIYIIFDKKPEQAMIDKLKGSGWRWTPSAGAWGRKRTDAAIDSARRLVGLPLEASKFVTPKQAQTYEEQTKVQPYVSTLPDKVVSIVDRSNVTPKEVGKWEITKTESVNPEQRWVYGSQDNQWHLVSSNDRDYAHGISQDRMKLIGQEAAKFEYLSPALTKPALLYPAKTEPSRYPDPAITTTPKVFTYYFRNRPPSIGTHPEGAVMKEEWMPMRKTPKGNMAFGWVSYERELSADEIKSYELFVDEIVMPKLVAELVKFTHDEGIPEGFKELKSEHGKALIGWLKANNDWKPDKGEEAEFLRHLARLTGVTQPKPKHVPDTSSKDYKAGYNLAIQGRIAPAVPAWTDQGQADFAQGYKDGQVAKTRKENEELLAKDKAARDKILYKEQAEEQELNEELNRLAPQYKSFIEREITGILHMSKDDRKYHDRFVIALGKTRSIILEIQQKSKKEERDCIKFDVKQAIKLVADTVETIRRPDVFRALNQNKEHAIELANFIKSKRMDLIEEVNKCLVEMGLKEQPSYIKEETERVFGKPVQAIPEKPRVMGAPSRQEQTERELRAKAHVGKAAFGQKTLSSGISVSTRLKQFEEKPIIPQQPVKSMADENKAREADAKEEWEAMEMARAAVGRITEQKIKMQIECEKRAE